MSDKAENRPQTTQDNSVSSLNFYDIMQGAAAGAAAGALLGKPAEGAVIGGAIAGGAVSAGLRALDRSTAEAVVQGAITGGAVGAGAALAADRGVAEGAAAAMVGGVAGAIGKQVVQENQKEIQAAGKAIKNEVKRQVNELLDTPKDVGNHIRNKPVTAAVETIICPPLVIIHSKLDKWFGK